MSDKNKEDTQAAFERGSTCSLNDDFEQGIKEFSEAIKLNPTKFEYFQSRGMIYAKVGQHRLAIEDTTEAIRLNQNDSTSYRIRGMAYFCIDQIDQAIKDLDEAIKINPDDYLAYMSRGVSFVTKGSKLNNALMQAMYTNVARGDFESVIKLNPDNLTLNHAKNMLYKIGY